MKVQTKLQAAKCYSKPGSGFVDYLVADVNIRNNIGFPTFCSL